MPVAQPPAQTPDESSAFPGIDTEPKPKPKPKRESVSRDRFAGPIGDPTAASKRAEDIGSLAIQTEAKEEDSFEEKKDNPRDEIAAFALAYAPAWLVSATFHMLLMIVLALLLLPSLISPRIELETVWAESLGDQLEFDSFLAGTDDEMVEEPVITPDDLPWVDDPFATPPNIDIMLDGATAVSDLAAPVVGMALKGREAGMKKALLDAYGGTATTEAAVQSGLEWLARNQQSDGSWSLSGPYSGGAFEDNRPAATAMALLALQGAGNTHRYGKFSKNIARGWAWLLKQQGDDGCFFQQGAGGFNHRFYTQGQCTIALCELLGMSNDQEFREPAERAVKYCLDSQGGEGGWRYQPGSESDVSVTGWIVMALQSAKMAGVAVPKENLARVERYLDAIGQENGSRYPYQRGRTPTNVMTAEALLCRQYLGWEQDDPRMVNGVTWLTQPENLINYNKLGNVYYWYYAAQVTHHMEGDYWKRWNEVMRQEVPSHQVKTGSEEGSWDPARPNPKAPDGWEPLYEWAPFGGRLYVTCLSIYMLEVYYRHLPLYSSVSTFMDRP